MTARRIQPTPPTPPTPPEEPRDARLVRGGGRADVLHGGGCSDVVRGGGCADADADAGADPRAGAGAGAGANGAPAARPGEREAERSAPERSGSRPAARPAVRPVARRGGADPVKLLLRRHLDLCSRAVDPLEIAAGLEAHGMTDRNAARFRHRDVFSLAEELYARVPRDVPSAEEGPASAEAPPGGSASALASAAGPASAWTTSTWAASAGTAYPGTASARTAASRTASAGRRDSARGRAGRFASRAAGPGDSGPAALCGCETGDTLRPGPGFGPGPGLGLGLGLGPGSAQAPGHGTAPAQGYGSAPAHGHGSAPAYPGPGKAFTYDHGAVPPHGCGTAPAHGHHPAAPGASSLRTGRPTPTGPAVARWAATARYLLPGAGLLAVAYALRSATAAEAPYGWLLAAAGAVIAAAGLWSCLRRGPLRLAAGRPGAGPLWTCWLLGYALSGDALLASLLGGGPDSLRVATGAFAAVTAVGSALAIGPAAWCAHRFALRVRRALAGCRGPRDFAGRVRPALFAAVVVQAVLLVPLFLAAMALLPAGEGTPPGAFTGPPPGADGAWPPSGGSVVAGAAAVTLGGLLFAARLLAVHGFGRAASAGLAAACAAEAAALGSTLTARLPGLDAVGLPVEAAVTAFGPGAVPLAACAAAWAGLLVHAAVTLPRAASHAFAAEDSRAVGTAVTGGPGWR